MLGIILTGHGSFATGLYEAAEQIMGKQPQFAAINFPDGMSSDEFEIKLREALAITNQGDGVIFLTDILGGTPFRISAMLSLERENIEVITGTNMPLLLEMLIARDGLDSENFRCSAIVYGKQGVTSLYDESVVSKNSVQECQDGI